MVLEIMGIWVLTLVVLASTCGGHGSRDGARAPRVSGGFSGSVAVSPDVLAGVICTVSGGGAARGDGAHPCFRHGVVVVLE